MAAAGSNPVLSGAPPMLGLLLVAVQAGQLQFQSVQIPAGNQGARVRAADVNRDGNNDLVLGSYATKILRVACGDGAGGSNTTITSPLSYGTLDFVLSDFDGDGITDAVMAEGFAAGGALGIALGNGAGGFVNGPFIANTPDDANSVAAGDINNDGYQDFAYGFFSFPFTYFYFGNGDGTFTFAGSVAANAHQSIAMGDYNGDGFCDTATAGFPNGIRVILGGAAPGAPVDYPFGQPLWIAQGDFDLDGRIDLAVNDGFNTTLRIVFGDGAGGFGNPVSTGLPQMWNAIEAGDLTLDGVPDVIGVVVGPGRVGMTQFLPGVGFTGYQEFLAAPSATRLAITDFDHNGLPDIAVSNTNETYVQVLLQQKGAPPGIVAFGEGTPGCAGTHGLFANAAPQIGSPKFAFECTNAPPNSLGLGIIGDLGLDPGVDTFAIFVLLHVDLLGSSSVQTFDWRTDDAGIGRGPVPIPLLPALVGNTYAVQGVWLWNETKLCAPTPLGLSSTPGLSVTIQ
jgi:hypothetical protein